MQTLTPGNTDPYFAIVQTAIVGFLKPFYVWNKAFLAFIWVVFCAIKCYNQKTNNIYKFLFK